MTKVEIIRAIYERWGRGDLNAGTERYDPNIQFVLRADFPEPGVYTGPEELRRYVVVRVHERATGPESGAEVTLDFYNVWTFRGESVIRLESIKERGDALAAARIAE